MQLLTTVATATTIIAGLVAIAWYVLDFRSRFRTSDTDERMRLLEPILSKIKNESRRLVRVRNGEHLNPDLKSTTKASLLDYTFANIREGVGLLSNDRRYKRLGKQITHLIDNREYHDPRAAVRQLDSLLPKFEAKIEGELRSLRRLQ